MKVLFSLLTLASVFSTSAMAGERSDCEYKARAKSLAFALEKNYRKNFESLEAHGEWGGRSAEGNIVTGALLKFNDVAGKDRKIVQVMIYTSADDDKCEIGTPVIVSE